MKKYFLLLPLFVVVLFSFSAYSNIENNQWFTYQHDNQRSGQSDFKGPEIPALKWKLKLDYFQNSSWNHSCPVIGKDGSIFITSLQTKDSAKLYALNADGLKKWDFETDFRMDNISPTISPDGTIFIYSNNSSGLIGINPNGSLKWKLDVLVISSITIDNNGKLIFVSHDGSDYCLISIESDGSFIWQFKLDSEPIGAPSIGYDKTIYLSTKKGKLNAVNPDGSLKWQFEIKKGFPSSSPSIGKDGTIYLRFGVKFPINDYSNSSYLYAINPDGSEKWNIFTEENHIHSPPAISKEGTIYTYLVTLNPFSNHLVAFAPDGYEIWRYKLDNIPLPPAVIDSKGTIFVQTMYDHMLYAINFDGSLKWKSNLIQENISNQSALAIGSDGTLFCCTLDNTIYAVFDVQGLSSNMTRIDFRQQNFSEHPVNTTTISKNITSKKTSTTPKKVVAIKYTGKLNPIHSPVKKWIITTSSSFSNFDINYNSNTDLTIGAMGDMGMDFEALHAFTNPTIGDDFKLLTWQPIYTENEKDITNVEWLVFEGSPNSENLNNRMSYSLKPIDK